LKEIMKGDPGTASKLIFEEELGEKASKVNKKTFSGVSGLELLGGLGGNTREEE